MGDCAARKAFDALWSVTNEVIRYVADIRTILNDAKGLGGGHLSSGLTSYENPVPQSLIERLSQKVTCLENLRDKRKAILAEFSNALKNDELNKKKQIREIRSENEYANPRDNALKSLVSYADARQAALLKDLDLLEQASQKLFDFCNEIGEADTAEEESSCGCSKKAQQIFLEGMKISQKLSTNMTNNRIEILTDGKLLEETILKIPHETNEETSKILENAQHSHVRIRDGYMFTFDDHISPILKEYLEIQTGPNIRDTVRTVIINMEHSFVKHTRMVQAYNQALQSLANHLIT